MLFLPHSRFLLNSKQQKLQKQKGRNQEREIKQKGKFDKIKETIQIERKRQSAVKSDTDNTRVGTLIVATIYLQLIQNRYTFRSSTVLQCSHQHCVQPIASDVEVVGYL